MNRFMVLVQSFLLPTTPRGAGTYSSSVEDIGFSIKKVYLLWYGTVVYLCFLLVFFFGAEILVAACLRNMGRHHHHHHDHESHSPCDDPFLACCCCPCYLVTSLLRGIGRCLFVSCYPVLQCFGLDECRHRHHHHHHSHFSWFYQYSLASHRFVNMIQELQKLDLMLWQASFMLMRWYHMG